MEYGSERPQDEARRKMESDADKLKREAGQLTREGAQAARDRAESGKERAAEELDSLSEAVDRAASAFSEEDREGLANYMRSASEQMSSLSRRLHERSIDELTEDAKRLARRNPAAFMLGSIALGFGLSRFLKASPPGQRREEELSSQASASYPGAYGASPSARPRSQPAPGASSYQSPGGPGAKPGENLH